MPLNVTFLALAMREHEQVDHGEPNPTPVPAGCLMATKVVYDALERALDEVAPAVQPPPAALQRAQAASNPAPQGASAPPAMFELLTLAQGAALLGLNPATLRLQVRRGRIQATKYGKTWLMTRGEVELYRVTYLRKGGSPK